MKKIFISYSWAKDIEANLIDDILNSFNVEIIRDVRDLKHLSNISDFMDRINESDLAILLVSDSYVKSKNCMYEVLRLIENKNLKTKAIPILLDDIKISSALNRLEYLKYWENQISELQFGIENNLSSFAFVNNLIKDLEQFQLIRNKLDDFFIYINDHLYFIFEDQKKKNFEDVIKYLNIESLKKSDKIEYKAKETIERIKIKPHSSNINVVDIYRLLLSIANNKNITTQRLLGHLQEIIENICYYFKEKTKSNCSVSLKLITETKPKTKKISTSVLTLVRDKKSNSKYSEFDKIQERILDNTSYSYVLNNAIANKKQIYVSNDLTAEMVFKSSSFEIFGKLKNNVFGRVQWPLPYISLVTIPIYNGNDPESKTILGFLNIESDKKNSFKNGDDLQIMTEIGELLFFPLMRLNNDVE